ncbi:MAG: T9SS type A sorting domain-containing protein [Candidatus Cloacimonetes bacterium]|nr:T9SS type A sorting domain-containing protein [Candidatus Cloacimonadota bacterium]MBS3767193.1 T9SS type A sorting domain-containing protein [Candidatus Cloacimonadota bacterium]
MWNESSQFPYLVPVIWQIDANVSPHVNQRANLYNVGGVPHAQWNGTKNVIGGGSGVYSAYVSQYNQLIDYPSPAEITTDFNSNNPGELTIESEVNLTDDITTTNNKIIFLLTYDYGTQQTPDYFCSVIAYEDQDFNLTSTGQTETYSHTFTIGSSYEVPQMNAVVIVQSLDTQPLIHQASITGFTGLYPSFSSNVVQGPPELQVDFTNLSLPDSIDTWEWDLDGDGTIDSYEENPTFTYGEVGTYNVSLTIYTDNDSASTSVDNYITVTQPSNVSGSLAGNWKEAHSPYQIMDNILVPADAELTIEPGVEMIFANNTEMKIKGKLTANGLVRGDEPISFTSNESWKGILFSFTDENNLIQNCIIEKATTSAIRVENSSHVHIIQNQISNNSSTSRAAGIDLLASDSIYIQKNIISNNTNTNLTAGIGCTGTTAEISNNIIVNNTGMIGAFSLKNGSDVEIINNTIANNESTYNTPYLFLIFDSNPQIRNSILISEGNLFYNSGGYPNVNYSCLSENYVGAGNINANPQFVDPSAGNGSDFNGLTADWSLASGSPAINAGDPDSIYNDTDGSRNDMGAYGGPEPYEGLQLSVNQENNVFSKLSVYPNPVKTNAEFQNIRLNLKKSARVTIELFNIKGRKVATLADEISEAGEYTFSWDMKNNDNFSQSSGIYLYRIKIDEESIFRKTLILK